MFKLVSSGKLTTLVFHKIPKTHHPLCPAELDLADFTAVLQTTMRRFRILPLDEALVALRAGNLPPNAACITFDDGYPDWLSGVVPVLERLGVSATVLWTALTGFTAVAAVAFFALWSVLSNMFCALLIFTMGPFRLGDTVEVIESADKPGVKGKVISINLFYTTLQDLSEEAVGAVLQVPNSLFFQKSVRRWR